MNATQKLILSWLQAEGAPLGRRADSGVTIRTGEITDADGTDVVAYHATREVAAGAVDSIDLRNLTHTVLGVTSAFSFGSVLAASACNLSTNAGDYLHVGADPASPQHAYSMRLRPGAWMAIWDGTSGWPITTPNHVLAVANVGQHAIPYHIVLLGRKATP